MLDTVTKPSVDHWLRPRFDGESIVNLMSSISAGMGVVSSAYPPLKLLPPRQVAEARHVVLLVVDGLGYRYLTRPRHAGSQLWRHITGSMTSVFPSTTATAVTSFVTGVAPQQHGVTGWYTYLPNADQVCAVLPFRVRGTNEDLQVAAAKDIVWVPPLFERFAAKSFVVMPEHIVESPFTRLTTGAVTRVPYQDLQSCVQNVVDMVRRGEQRTFVYAYWPQFDTVCHEFGVSSEQTEAHFREIDAAFAHLVAALQGSDTLLLVTADHGLIDTQADRYLSLNDHPQLMAMLRHPLSGEPRAAYCHVLPDKLNDFENYIKRQFAESIALFNSMELLEQGYFGRGKDLTLASRIGDFVLLMRDNFVIKDYMIGERAFTQLGVHGGLSAEELLVPLIKVRL